VLPKESRQIPALQAIFGLIEKTIHSVFVIVIPKTRVLTQNLDFLSGLFDGWRFFRKTSIKDHSGNILPDKRPQPSPDEV
jgi:hypothetical protein